MLWTLLTAQAAPVGWPNPGAPLHPVALSAPRNLPDTTVFVVGGHANGRTKKGNTGVHGQIEADVNLWTAEQLVKRLEATGWFRVVMGRTGEQRPSYGARIRHAERVGADVFIELHTDARGHLIPWAYTPNEWVYRADGAFGFSVLYNEGSSIGPERRRLAQHVGAQLSRIGLPPFPEYGNAYDNDAVPGVCIDRRGLMMLRRPSIPSIIIETHNAKDFEESLRWRETATLDAFASALIEAISAFRRSGRGPTDLQ
jgi:N-acetylmuramoyl-L-alanine amidase